jgi:uncharacterized glyoxalase superfamily protein PhnB
MKTNELSTCFITKDVEACREFYRDYFSANAIFDCGWYVSLRIAGDGPSIQFMLPQGDTPTFGGTGIMLNFNVDDVDAEHTRLTEAGLPIAGPLEDHPWGDRGFSVMDPIGNFVYIYSDREPSDEFRQHYKTNTGMRLASEA